MAASPTTMVGWMNRAVAWCWWSSLRSNHIHHCSQQQHRRLSLAAAAAAASSSSSSSSSSPGERRRSRHPRHPRLQQQQLSSASSRVLAPTTPSWFGSAPKSSPSISVKTNSRRRGSMGKSSSKKQYYAVANGRRVGIFDTWDECSSQVMGFKMARYKSFSTRHEAMAFLADHADGSSAPKRPTDPSQSVSSSSSSSSFSHDSRPGSGGPPPPLRSGTKRPLVATVPSVDADAGLQPSVSSESTEVRSNAAHVIRTNPYQKKAATGAPPRSATHSSRIGAWDGTGTARRIGASATSRSSHGEGTAAHPERQPRLTIHINFDGGSRGNPGLAGAGASVTVSSNEPLVGENGDGNNSNNNDEGGDGGRRRTIHVRHFLTRKATNNEAEYEGLVAALRVAKQQAQWVLHNDRRHGSARPPTIKLIVQGDSDLIIKQLKGSYQVKNPKLVPLYQMAVRLIQDVRAMTAHGGGCEVVYEHVYREFNKVADGLANQAMDGQRSWMTSSEEGNHSVEINLPFD